MHADRQPTIGSTTTVDTVDEAKSQNVTPTPTEPTESTEPVAEERGGGKMACCGGAGKGGDEEDAKAPEEAKE